MLNLRRYRAGAALCVAFVCFGASACSANPVPVSHQAQAAIPLTETPAAQATKKVAAGTLNASETPTTDPSVISATAAIATSSGALGSNPTPGLTAPAISPTATTGALNLRPTAIPTPLPPTPIQPTPTAAPAGRIYAVGDSVMLGAETQLEAAGITVNAETDRSWDSGLAVVQGWAAQGIHPKILVVHLGNNSAVSVAEVDAMMAAAGGAQVYFVEVYEPSLAAHMQEVNATLAGARSRYANAHLINWPAVAASAVCSSDQIHISCGGAQIYANLVVSSVA